MKYAIPLLIFACAAHGQSVVLEGAISSLSLQDIVAAPGGGVYAADADNDAVWFIKEGETPVAIVTSLGTGMGQQLEDPWALIVDGNLLYIAGRASDNVFSYNIDTQEIIEVIGPAGNGMGVFTRAPEELAVDSEGDLLVMGDDSDNVIRLEGTTITEEIFIMGYEFIDVEVDLADNVLVSVSNDSIMVPEWGIYRINDSQGTVEIIDEMGDGVFTPASLFEQIAISPDGRIFVIVLGEQIVEINSDGFVVDIFDDPAFDPVFDLVVTNNTIVSFVSIVPSSPLSVTVWSVDRATKDFTEIVDESGSQTGGPVQISANLTGDETGRVYFSSRPRGAVWRIDDPVGQLFVDGFEALLAR